MRKLSVLEVSFIPRVPRLLAATNYPVFRQAEISRKSNGSASGSLLARLVIIDKLTQHIRGRICFVTMLVMNLAA
jgi:hypothetical protein